VFSFVLQPSLSAGIRWYPLSAIRLQQMRPSWCGAWCQAEEERIAYAPSTDALELVPQTKEKVLGRQQCHRPAKPTTREGAEAQTQPRECGRSPPPAAPPPHAPDHPHCTAAAPVHCDLVENRTRVMRAPTRGLAKALRGIYWGGGGGPSLPPARSIRPASGVYKTRQDKPPN
jgi:hypothetical protein